MDDELEELFEFISGKTFPHFGKGITTYPNYDENSKKLHSALLELEKLGKVKRHLEKKDYIVWMPIENI